jgi:hypothetical protein
MQGCLFLCFFTLVMLVTSQGHTQQARREPAYVPPGPDWMRSQDADNSVTWLHLSTRRRQANFAQIWEVRNFKAGHEFCQPGWGCSASFRTLLEFDCRERRYRELAVSTHAGTGGQGRVIFQDNQPNQWAYIPPGTVAETTMSTACR